MSIGYVFAVNGKINSADVYASNALFRKLWPRLLKASATEALGAKTADTKVEAPAPAMVDAFLAAAASGKASEREPAKGMKLKVRDSDKAVDFETRRCRRRPRAPQRAGILRRASRGVRPLPEGLTPRLRTLSINLVLPSQAAASTRPGRSELVSKGASVSASRTSM